MENKEIMTSWRQYSKIWIRTHKCRNGRCNTLFNYKRTKVCSAEGDAETSPAIPDAARGRQWSRNNRKAIPTHNLGKPGITLGGSV
jgi:hypothetical protein